MIGLIVGGIGVAKVFAGGVAAKTLYDRHEAKKTNEFSRDIIQGTKSKIKDFKNYCKEGLRSLGNSEIDVINNELSEFVSLFSQIHSIDVSEFSECYKLADYCFDRKDSLSVQGLQSALSSKSSYDHPVKDVALSAAIGSLAGFGVGAVAPIPIPIGAIVLGFISMKNAKALREESDVNFARAREAEAKGALTAELYSGIRKKAAMYERLLFKLTSLFTPLVFALDGIIQTSGTDYSKYSYEQKKTVAAAMSLAGAIKAVIDVPILDDNGDLSAQVDKTADDMKRYITAFNRNDTSDVAPLKPATLEDAENDLLNCRFESALEQFEQLASSGNPRAMYFLGKFYCRHYGYCKYDGEKAVSLFERGMSLNNPLCAIQYGKNLNDEDEQKRVLGKFFPILNKNCDHNDPFELCELALCYKYGRGVAANLEKAKELLFKSAELNWVGAAELLGELYEEQKQYAESAKWYSKAASQGYPKAERQLAWSYWLGNGLKEDDNKAAEWAKKAASHGDSEGQYLLGMLYKEGMGLEKNPIEAISWLRKAIAQGNVGAMNKLGECYEEGFGVMKNITAAVEWYMKSAKHGFKPAVDKLTQPRLKKIAYEISFNGSTAKVTEKSVTSFDAEIFICEGKNHGSLVDNFKLDIRFEGEYKPQTCRIHTEGNILFPGNEEWVTIELFEPKILKNGQSFEMFEWEGRKKLAEGTVSL